VCPLTALKTIASPVCPSFQRFMDVVSASTSLIATIFQDGAGDVGFREFLHGHLATFDSSRVLKSFSPSDTLVVTEHCFTFGSNADSDITAIRKSAREWFKGKGVEVAIQRDDVFRRYKRLVVFDMDSTLIKQEVIDEIAAYLDEVDKQRNVGGRVAVHTPNASH
jgi:hypothetical protein